MELKVDMPALSGQNIDPATFRRVWDRVMPGQPAPRDNTSVPDTAVPAQPSPSPSEAAPELPPVPTCPAEPAPERPPVPTCPAEPAPELPSVPVCPAEPAPELPSVPVCPAEPAPELPPVPDCPAQTGPAVPSCPTQPSVPGCPTQPSNPGCSACPSTPALCLGEASQGDSGQLEQLMTLAQEGAAAARMLARRSSGSCARTLSAMAQDHRSAFRRLSAAYFLITGKRYIPKCAAPSLPASLPLALRQQFVWEQQWEQKNQQAAQATADPCLKALYEALAQEGVFHAGAIRSLLEQM